MRKVVLFSMSDKTRVPCKSDFNVNKQRLLASVALFDDSIHNLMYLKFNKIFFHLTN